MNTTIKQLKKNNMYNYYCFLFTANIIIKTYLSDAQKERFC